MSPFIIEYSALKDGTLAITGYNCYGGNENGYETINAININIIFFKYTTAKIKNIIAQLQKINYSIVVY